MKTYLYRFPSATYPREVHTNLPSSSNIASFREMAHGCFWVRRRRVSSERLLVVSGGMHGDEKAGIFIVETLLNKLTEGVINLHTDTLLLFGNIEAAFAQDGKGVRALKENGCGHFNNLNRCFGTPFSNPKCYAQKRANEIMHVLEEVAPKYKRIDAIDVHQSFAVPLVEEVRDNCHNRTEYTYAMAYPGVHPEHEVLNWFYQEYSDIVAGVVLYPPGTYPTFAGYMAATFGAYAATFEQGTIGYLDEVTYTPQLLANLERKLSGRFIIDKPLGFDVWEKRQDIIKEHTDFTFLDINGNPTHTPPRDFVAFPQQAYAKQGGVLIYREGRERLLFANPDVPVGDRTACVIARKKENGGIALPPCY